MVSACLLVAERLMQRLTAHLRDVDETYTEHMACAAGFAWALLLAACACAVHAVLPFWFVHTASHRVRHLEERMRTRAEKRSMRETAVEPVR